MTSWHLNSIGLEKQIKNFIVYSIAFCVSHALCQIALASITYT